MDRARHRRPVLCATSAPAPGLSCGATVPDRPPGPSERVLVLSQFAAGAISGIANVVLLSPLEVVKVRLQAQARGGASSATRLPRYTGLGQALRVMLREEGWRSYYRGMSASLWAFVPNWAVFWFSYEALKRRLVPPSDSENGPGLFAAAHVASAFGAGLFTISAAVNSVSKVSAGSLTAVATAPMWTLKSRMQTDLASGAKRRYKSVWSGLRKIAADEGFAALYKGLSPTLLGIGHVMLQFPVYEHIKQRLSNNCEDNVQPMHILVASSVSKIVASAAFYHHEVVRTSMQIDIRAHGRSEPARMAYLYRDIFRREGIKGLYRGFSVNLLRTVPNCIIAFSAYEYAKRLVLRSAGDVIEAKRQPRRLQSKKND